MEIEAVLNNVALIQREKAGELAKVMASRPRDAHEKETQAAIIRDQQRALDRVTELLRP